VQRESQVLQQEMILKNYITRSGLDYSGHRMARIIPTDHIEVPPQEAVIPWQDLVAEAIAHRPKSSRTNRARKNSRPGPARHQEQPAATLSFSATLAITARPACEQAPSQVPILNGHPADYRVARPLAASDLIRPCWAATEPRSARSSSVERYSCIYYQM